ncbi:hypothetical protein [Massilia brevitalea]|uniref:hypothetical protein n=1 Tax=Massilia brevitalea TaxID=442526 RepID=UPI0027399E70|nr:hypothetical protein [Massilia brevitalea]
MRISAGQAAWSCRWAQHQRGEQARRARAARQQGARVDVDAGAARHLVQGFVGFAAQRPLQVSPQAQEGQAFAVAQRRQGVRDVADDGGVQHRPPARQRARFAALAAAQAHAHGDDLQAEQQCQQQRGEAGPDRGGDEDVGMARGGEEGRLHVGIESAPCGVRRRCAGSGARGPAVPAAGRV